MEMISLNFRDPIEVMRDLSINEREEFLESFQAELENRYGLPIEAIADMIQ